MDTTRPSTLAPAHPARLTVLLPRVAAYGAAAALAFVEGVAALPGAPWWFAWCALAPWLTRVPVPPLAGCALRLAESVLTPGLALAAGLSFTAAGALLFVGLLGQLNVHGLRGGGVALAGGLAGAGLALVAGAQPALAGPPLGILAAALLAAGFSAAAAVLSHRQARRLDAAGAALASQADAQRALAGRLARYLPPAVHRAEFEGLAAGAPAPGSRRRWLTVCFADLAGFTAFTDRAESEEVVAFLDAFYGATAEAARTHGGTLDKFIGDGAMVFFGDPVTRGRRDDARDALALALALQRRFRDLRERAAPGSGARELGLRVGLHSGWCTLGTFGAGTRLEYTVIGATVNAASRLEGAARPGTVLLSGTTRALLGAAGAPCRPLGPLTVRGLRTPLEAFELDPGAADPQRPPLSVDGPGFALHLDPRRADAPAVRAALARAAALLGPVSAAPSRNRLTVSESDG
ncbi:MAG: adenylate/guanylate cyclase domain-containing protein [Pseudomonadales bacterium]|jgi:class 3 adenylate cyclase|nr:adenylate/guanylate cyclase domain-containing protein [Pseudomonadales bacterium]